MRGAAGPCAGGGGAEGITAAAIIACTSAAVIAAGWALKDRASAVLIML
jgi:hypothetical protein